MRIAVICLASALALMAGCSKKPAERAASGASAAAPATTANAPTSAKGGILTPHRKAGLWQLAIDTSGGPGVSFTGQTCVDASTDQDFAWHGPHSTSQNCDKTVMRPTLGGLAFDSVCRMGKRTITSHGVVTGDFNTAYNVDVTTRMDPAQPGMPTEMRSQVKAKWMGACPQGMKPGSVKMGGMTIGR